MKNWLAVLTFATFISAHAQQFSGPNDLRVPRAQENESINRAVCAAKVPLGKGTLGKLSGCQPKLWPGDSVSQVGGPGGNYFLAGVLAGSFTAPGRQEVLASYCLEGEGCAGQTALLRRMSGRWRAVQSVSNFWPARCLTYPKPDGTQAAVCLGESAKPLGQALQVVTWASGKPKVDTVALFPYLNFAGPQSQQCAGGWNYQPFSWDDHDRNADGIPDLTLLALLDTYSGGPELCQAGQDFEAKPSQSVRRDLTFVWTGQGLRPTGDTANTLNRYARRQ